MQWLPFDLDYTDSSMENSFKIKILFIEDLKQERWKAPI